MDRIGGCQIVYGGTGSLHVDLPAPTGTPLCKNKEGKGSARAWPVAAPMPKSDSFSREKREMLNDGCWHSIFSLPSPWGWLSLYNVSCSQFEGCRDSLLLDRIFPAFIE